MEKIYEEYQKWSLFQSLDVSNSLIDKRLVLVNNFSHSRNTHFWSNQPLNQTMISFNNEWKIFWMKKIFWIKKIFLMKNFLNENFYFQKLDYFSAYSVVIYSLCALTIKVLDNKLIGKIVLKAHLAIAMPFLAFFLYHIHYLFYIHFDYGYNMKVNVYTGLSLNNFMHRFSSLKWQKIISFKYFENSNSS
jgi:hypothetical protein